MNVARLLSKKHTEGRASPVTLEQDKYFSLSLGSKGEAVSYTPGMDVPVKTRPSGLWMQLVLWRGTVSYWVSEKNLKHTVGWALGELEGWLASRNWDKKEILCPVCVRAPNINTQLNSVHLDAAWTSRVRKLNLQPELIWPKTYTNDLWYFTHFHFCKTGTVAGLCHMALRPACTEDVHLRQNIKVSQF